MIIGDSNKVLTQHLNLPYWLSQKKYLDTEKFFSDAGSLLLVHTHTDEESNVYPQNISGFNIDDHFQLSLNPADNTKLTALSREHLKALILDRIQKQTNIREEPQWYIDFIRFILAEAKNASHKPMNVRQNILPHYRRQQPNAHAYLMEELDQLHKKGLILYYRDQMPDVVWLNPQTLVDHIHKEILPKDDADLKTAVVPVAKFSGVSSQIIQLLLLQKVIFQHANGDHGPEYIIPNFLPLVEKDDPETYFYFFGFYKPAFTLKFTNFMPFGLINQLISSVAVLPQRKKFWRNQLLFTFQDNANILIKIDNQQLEIKLHIRYRADPDDKTKSDIQRYLFYLLMTTYWDMEILTFDQYSTFMTEPSFDPTKSNQPHSVALDHARNLYETPECRPIDLHISLDQTHFVEYAQLYIIQSPLIATKVQFSDGQLVPDGEAILVYPFEPFTNRIFRKAKKVAISYSKQDLELVNNFRKNLIPLSDLGLIENPWYCTLLLAGQDWDAEIKRRFAEADLIFFMISENLMATKYVKENEIKNAIDRQEIDKNVKIIPILLQYVDWPRPGKYNQAKFSGFPYALKPVAAFKNQQTAWYMIEQSVRLTLEKDLNPLQDDITFTTEMQKLQQDLMKGKLEADL